MATGIILNVLSNIPWGQVVDKAPTIADGAVRLWSTATSFRKKKVAELNDIKNEMANSSLEIQTLRESLANLTENVQILSEQMSESSRIIKELAEQNSQLILRVDFSRKQILQLKVLIGILGIGEPVRISV